MADEERGIGRGGLAAAREADGERECEAADGSSVHFGVIFITTPSCVPVPSTSVQYTLVPFTAI